MDMTAHMNDIGAAVTVLFFVTFIGIVLWAYDRKKKDRFEADARIPLDEDQPVAKQN